MSREVLFLQRRIDNINNEIVQLKASIANVAASVAEKEKTVVVEVPAPSPEAAASSSITPDVHTTIIDQLESVDARIHSLMCHVEALETQLANDEKISNIIDRVDKLALSLNTDERDGRIQHLLEKAHEDQAAIIQRMIQLEADNKALSVSLDACFKTTSDSFKTLEEANESLYLKLAAPSKTPQINPDIKEIRVRKPITATPR
jgi:hypothetical protein